VVGSCRVSLAQGDVDLEAPGLAAFAIWAFWLSRQRRMPAVAIALVLGVVAWSPFAAPVSGGTTLFQNVREGTTANPICQ